MKQESLLCVVMDHCHAQDPNGAAKILDVEGGCEGHLELPRPLRIAAKNQQVINVDGNVDHQRRGD